MTPFAGLSRHERTATTPKRHENNPAPPPPRRGTRAQGPCENACGQRQERDREQAQENGALGDGVCRPRDNVHGVRSAAVCVLEHQNRSHPPDVLRLQVLEVAGFRFHKRIHMWKVGQFSVAHLQHGLGVLRVRVDRFMRVFVAAALAFVQKAGVGHKLSKHVAPAPGAAGNTKSVCPVAPKAHRKLTLNTRVRQ